MVLFFFALMPFTAIKASALTANVESENGFKSAVESEAYKNGTVYLTKDITITQEIIVLYPMTIDMQGHTITVNKNFSLKFDPKAGNTVTITGYGTFKGNTYSGVLKLYKGNISFLNGKIINEYQNTSRTYGYAFIADHNNDLQNITIKEGEFYSNADIHTSTDASNGHVTLDGNSCFFTTGTAVAGLVHMIVLPKNTDIGIMVAGNTVTAAISKDILGDGVFEYNPTNKTLYVKGRLYRHCQRGNTQHKR